MVLRKKKLRMFLDQKTLRSGGGRIKRIRTRRKEENLKRKISRKARNFIIVDWLGISQRTVRTQ